MTGLCLKQLTKAIRYTYLREVWLLRTKSREKETKGINNMIRGNRLETNDEYVNYLMHNYRWNLDHINTLLQNRSEEYYSPIVIFCNDKILIVEASSL